MKMSKTETEQLESLQSEIQSENIDQTQEFEAQNVDSHNNLIETETEVSQDYNVQEQTEYTAPTDENVHQNESQNQEHIPEEPQHKQPEFQPGYTEQIHESAPDDNIVENNQNQPAQINNQSDYSSEIRIPPFDIREIKSHPTPESEQYSQTPDESDQPEQTNDEHNPENPGY